MKLKNCYNKKYLGWDFFVLDALFPLAFELVLDLSGQVGLALEASGDSVAGNLELGLAVDALGRSGKPLTVLLLIKKCRIFIFSKHTKKSTK